MIVGLPGTYQRCMAGGHYYAVVRGDEECPVCEQVTALKARVVELEQDSANLKRQRDSWIELHDALIITHTAVEKERDKLAAGLAQVDDILHVNFIGVKDNNYREAIHGLISWEIKVHDDPAVSEVAAKRKAEYDKLAAQVEKLRAFAQEITNGIIDSTENPIMEISARHGLYGRIEDDHYWPTPLLTGEPE